MRRLIYVGYLADMMGRRLICNLNPAKTPHRLPIEWKGCGD